MHVDGALHHLPDGSLHRVALVARGTRLASFFWLQSLVRDDAARHMLFELDQTLHKLRAREGDSAEVPSLTALHHNLVRRWAAT